MIENNTTYKFTYKLIFLLFIGIAITGCKDKFKTEDSFIRIYDDTDVNKNYYPLSIERTSDQGYITLSAIDGWNIHIMKTDWYGNLEWKYELPSQYVNAVPHLIERFGNLYFVCMDAVGLYTYIMKIDQSAKNTVIEHTFEEIEYPMCIFDNETEVYIQNYQKSTFRTGIHQLDNNMTQILKSGEIDIYTDVESQIINHLNYTGNRYPFSVSVTPEKNQILVNGFNNYSFSTVFLDSDLEFTGVYNGAAFNGGLSAILPLGSNKYSLARFSFSDMYVNPNAYLSSDTIEIVESIPALINPELDADSPVLIKKLNINFQEHIVYLATTKSNQLLLTFYLEGSDEVAATKYIGQNTPLEACDFEKTDDGGLMILARTTVLGSFNRIALIKYSKEELNAMAD